MRGGRARMKFGVGFIDHLSQLCDATRLRAGLVLRQHASRRQKERVFVISLFIGGVVTNRVESRPSARGRERTREEARLAGMRFIGARPKDSLILIDLSPSYAVVIGDAAP